MMVNHQTKRYASKLMLLIKIHLIRYKKNFIKTQPVFWPTLNVFQIDKLLLYYCVLTFFQIVF